MQEELIALDFETANPQRVSACSVGGAVIRDGQIVDQFATLIKPPTDNFAPINVRIHHITPDMVANAPTFADIFPRFKERVEGKTILCYSKFDISVINSLFEHYGCCCAYNHIDVLSLARKMLPDLKNHKLPTVAKALNLGTFNHHDGGADALMCAKVYLALMKGSQDKDAPTERSVDDAIFDFIDVLVSDDEVDYKEAVELRSFLEVLEPHPVLDQILVAVEEFLSDGVISAEESKWLVDSLKIVQQSMLPQLKN